MVLLQWLISHASDGACCTRLMEITVSKVTYGLLVDILPILQGKRLERFLSRIDRSGGPDACHPWIGKTGKLGYALVQGSVQYQGYSFLAHRVAWALARGEEPNERIIRHSCDNPPCCNERHLIAGTLKDNHADMIQRGRAAHPDDPFLARGKLGPAANAAIYTAEQRAQALSDRYIRRRPIQAIADKLGCHRATLHRWFKEYEAAVVRGNTTPSATLAA